MPRNGSGSYTLPEAPFVPLTTISSSAMNSDLSDIATAMTGSLARDGQGGMTAVLPLAPAGFTYTTDTNTGIYRSASDTQVIQCGGSGIVTVGTTGADVVGSVNATTIKQNGISLIPVGLGPLPWSRTAAPSGWVFVGKTYSRTTYAALWAVAQAEIGLGNTFYSSGDGSTTFGVGLSMPGCVPFCNDSISGSAAGTLTQAVFGSSPAVVGNVGGDEDYLMVRSDMPNVTLSVSGTFSGAGTNFSPLITSGSGAAPDAGPGATGNPTPLNVAGTINGTTTSINGNVAQTRYKAVSPGIITNYIIYAGV